MTRDLSTFQFYNETGEKVRYKTLEETDDIDVFSFEIRLVTIDEEIDSCEMRVKSDNGLVSVSNWDEWGEYTGGGIVIADTNIPVVISPNIPFENEQFYIEVSDQTTYSFVDFGVSRVTDMDGVDLEGDYSIDSRNETMILMRFRNQGEFGILLFGDFGNGTILQSWKTIEVYQGEIDDTPSQPSGPTPQTDILWILLNTPGGGAVLFGAIIVTAFFMYRWKKPSGPSLEDLTRMQGDTLFMDEISARYKAPPSDRFPSIGTRQIQPRSEEERPP
jgi:hypothetical protein